MKLAVLCYIQKEEKTLMLEVNNPNSPVNGYWNGVGGKLEPGETPEACVIREVREETGLVVEKMVYAGLLVFPYNGQDKEPWYVFVYRVTDFSGEMLTDSPEGVLKWVDNSDLIDLRVSEGDKIFLPWILDEKIFSASFDYVGEKLKTYHVDFY